MPVNHSLSHDKLADELAAELKGRMVLLRRLARALVADSATADDLLQESLAAAWERRASIPRGQAVPLAVPYRVHIKVHSQSQSRHVAS